MASKASVATLAGRVKNFSHFGLQALGRVKNFSHFGLQALA